MWPARQPPGAVRGFLKKENLQNFVPKQNGIATEQNGDYSLWYPKIMITYSITMNRLKQLPALMLSMWQNEETITSTCLFSNQSESFPDYSQKEVVN